MCVYMLKSLYKFDVELGKLIWLLLILSEIVFLVKQIDELQAIMGFVQAAKRLKSTTVCK